MTSHKPLQAFIEKNMKGDYLVRADWYAGHLTKGLFQALKDTDLMLISSALDRYAKGEFNALRDQIRAYLVKAYSGRRIRDDRR